MAYAPTDEQQAIIDAFLEEHDLVIEAGAGTGKTSTLRFLAQAAPSRTGIYLAYNRAIADEAKASFPSNCRCFTAHSLAFRAVGRQYSHRLNGPRLPARVVAQRLGIVGDLSLPGDKVMTPAQLARIVTETVSNFCHSSDSRIAAIHCPRVNGLDDEASYELRRAVLPLAENAWKDIASIDGDLKFEHDHYLKIWGLSNPKLDCDFLFLDEAQDANPVLAAIVEAQTHVQRILVGDANQAIYGWRGAKDAMSDFNGKRLSLTQSFRFGPAVAEEANKWLTYLDATLRIRGFDQVPSTVEPLAAPRAILCRTNSGAVFEAIGAFAQGRRAALVGGGDSIKGLAEAARSLQQGQPTTHPELFMFAHWGEVQEYVTQDAAGSDLRVFVKLIDNLGPEEVISAINRLVPESVADVTISTAHKAKGREWDTVRIAGDFYTPKEEGKGISREEAMLAYVAVTRAKVILDRMGLAFIDSILEPTDVEAPAGIPADPRLVAAIFGPEVASTTQFAESSTLDLTPTDASVSVSPTSPATPEKEGELKVATVSGKYQKHEVTGDTTLGEKMGLKVTAWTLPDGKAAPKNAGLVGKTFETVGKAGIESIKAIRLFEKLEPLPTEMRLIFKAPDASKPINAREVGSKPKASKNGVTAPVAETPAKTSGKSKGKAKASKGSSPKVEGATSEQPTRSRRARKPAAVVQKYGDQEGVDKGQTRFWCAACSSAFVIETPKNGRVPDACPEGHSVESLDLGGDTSDQEIETLVI